jgi:hypothetical protein
VTSALGLAVLLSACASGDGMHTKLRDASSAYNRHLRWGDFDRAADYLPVASREAFLGQHDGFADELVIVDYQMTRLKLDKETGIAASRVEVSWHTERRLIVETTVVDQTWQWHEGNFVLVDEHRSGGKPLAIFAEQEETSHPYLPGLEAYRKAFEIVKENKRKGRRKRARSKGQDGTT